MSNDEPIATGSSRADHSRSRRRLDVASLTLLLVCLVSAGWCCWLIAHDHLNWLILTPSIVGGIAATTHLVKTEAPRDDR